MRIWVNDAPAIESVGCDQDEYARGDSFLCSVITSDDERVESVDMGWAVLCQRVPLPMQHGTWAVWDRTIMEQHGKP